MFRKMDNFSSFFFSLLSFLFFIFDCLPVDIAYYYFSSPGKKKVKFDVHL